MAAITINGTFRTHEITKIPGFVYAYPMSDFYLGAVAVKASSPEHGGNPYKTVAVTATPGAGDNLGTTVYTFSMILPSTVNADVNPVGARWGLYVFDTSDVPQKIEEIADLESFFLLETPTTVSLLDIRAQQGTSTPWPPSGGDQTVTGVLTVTGNLIVGGNINGRDPDNFLDGFGTANAYPIYTDSNTLQSGYLKQESLAVTMDGAGTAPEIRMMTNGLAGETNRTLGVLYADPNVIELTARRNGTFSAQVTAIRLNALGTTGLVQVARDGTVRWTFDGLNLKPNSGGTHTLGNFALPFAALELAFGGTGVTFWNSSAQQVSIQGNVVDTLSMFDSNGLQFARFNYGDNIYLQAGAGSPEGVITAKIGSLYSRTDGGASTSLYVKTSGTGNTGWTAK